MYNGTFLQSIVRHFYQKKYPLKINDIPLMSQHPPVATFTPPCCDNDTPINANNTYYICTTMGVQIRWVIAVLPHINM